MRSNAPPISNHRLQRAQRWMLLWLKWFAAFLLEARAFAPFSHQAEAIAHQRLDKIERLLVAIVLLRAAPHVRVTNTLKHAARPKTETQMRRAVVGSAMRRALRSKNLNRRIAALSQDVDGLVARLLKRLPCGLTRRRPHRPRRGKVRSIARATAHMEAAYCTDTS